MASTRFCTIYRMGNVLEYIYNNTILFIVFILICSVAIRGYVLYKSPGMNANIDLCILMDMGGLVSHGVNPYAFNDNVELRNTFRNDDIAYNNWVSETQERWDYFASTNLPLNGLYVGMIDTFFPGNAFAYRCVFIFVDIILCIIIALFIKEFFENTKSIYIKWFFILGLGAFNPLLLKWGILWPVDKNLQIVLMLLSLYCALKSKLLLSSMLLGCSVAFKGLGILIGPIVLCIWLRQTKDCAYRHKLLVYLCLLSIISCFIWFIPYLPEVITMMYERLQSDSLYAIHGSLWTLTPQVLKGYWKILRIVTICIFLAISLIAVMKDNLNYQIIFLGLLYSFTVLWLSSGSMDRYNIAILYIVISFGLIKNINYTLLACAYILISCLLTFVGFVFGNMFDQKYDAIFCFCFTICYIIILLHFCLSTREGISNHPKRDGDTARL